jgi:rod shape-determining protein MreC
MAILDNRVKSPRIVGKITKLIIRYFLITLVIVTLALTMIIKRIDKNNSIFLEITGTVYDISSSTNDFFGRIFSPITNYFSTNDALIIENRELRSQLEEMRIKLNDFEMTQNHNKEMSDLLNFVSSLNKKYISARILSLVSSAEGPYGIIDCGSKSGAEKNDIVVSSRGLVGKIVDLSDHYAKVLLVNNSRFRIPVITASGQRGILAGDAQTPYISYILDIAKIQPEETVFATSHEQSFMPEVIVGRISALEKDRAYLSTSADFNTRFVSILKTKN